MIYLVTAFLLVASWAQFATGQVVRFGQCPDLPAPQGFNLTEYLGTWYEIDRSFAIFEAGMTCVKAEYSQNPDGSVRVVNSGYNDITKRNSSIVGRATVPDPETNPARLMVQFSGQPISAPYQVVATDLKQYAVVYSCFQVIPRVFRTENLWLLSRTPALNPEIRQGALAEIDSLGIDRSGLSQTAQENCVYQDTQ